MAVGAASAVSTLSSRIISWQATYQRCSLLFVIGMLRNHPLADCQQGDPRIRLNPRDCRHRVEAFTCVLPVELQRKVSSDIAGLLMIPSRDHGLPAAFGRSCECGRESLNSINPAVVVWLSGWFRCRGCLSEPRSAGAAAPAWLASRGRPKCAGERERPVQKDGHSGGDADKRDASLR